MGWVQLFAVDADAAQSCTRSMNPETAAVSFADWKTTLADTGWSAEKLAEYRREILAFLHRCKVRRAPATIMLVKAYLAERTRQGPNGARVPLLWFFQTAKKPRDGRWGRLIFGERHGSEECRQYCPARSANGYLRSWRARSG